MKYFELDQEEKDILEEIDQDNFKNVPNAELLKKKYQACAKATLNKHRNIKLKQK